MDCPHERDPGLVMEDVDSSNEQPVQGPSITLPPEILSLVCGFLNKQTLKQVRHVSQVWERAADPYLFDNIFISQDLADFLIAKLVIRQFGVYVHTLVFSSIYYKKVHRFVFEQECDRQSAMGAKNNVNSCLRDSDYAFARYRTALENQQANITNGSCSAYLSFALTSLPNIRKIILTDASSSRSMRCQSMQAFEMRGFEPCPCQPCECSVADHIPYKMRESGFFQKDSTNPWRSVLSALSATNANVRELTMEPKNMRLATNTNAFSMSRASLLQAKLCFGKLTKLHLSLLMDIERLSLDVDTRHSHRNVAKLLRSAINLENLSLAIPPTYSCSLRGILQCCRFPKLKSLILENFTSSDEELLQLLEFSRSLEHITIERHVLSKGSWMRVADWIRASLPMLEYAELDHLCGGFDKPFKYKVYFDLYGDVSNFLFSDGENPFTKKALQKSERDTKEGRQVLKHFDELDFLKAFAEYHQRR